MNTKIVLVFHNPKAHFFAYFSQKVPVVLFLPKILQTKKFDEYSLKMQ